MLLELAHAENRSAANWLRSQIQRCYETRDRDRHTASSMKLLGLTRKKSERTK